ncbi:MAG TPA: methyl-accepting chemotaxis protein [Desulfobacterales bacterium]|nr:methyl-accepting chemotaxis protein [Desulfobacterales bacterium]
MRKRSLGFKLATGGIALVLMPLLVVGLFSVGRSTEALTALSQGQAELTARNLATMVDLVLSEEIKLAREMAVDRTSIRAAQVVSTSARTNAGEAIAALDEKLSAAMKQIGKDYEAFIATDTRGVIFADSQGGSYKGTDISERDYFKRAVAGQDAVSDPVRSKVSGNIVVPVSTPIHDQAGGVIGTLTTVLDIKFLTEKITALKIGQTGYPFLANAAGLVVAHPDQALILKTDISKIPEMSGIFTAMSTRPSGVEAYQFKGMDKIAGFAAVKTTNWRVGVTQNRDEFMAAPHAIRNVILTISGIFLAATILAVLFFTRSINRPINRVVGMLNAGADEVASASEQVSSASQTLAEGASQQAASIEETSSSLEEISSMTKQNADHAREANSLVTEATRTIARANESMGQLTTSMKEISTASEETQKIVKTIDEIAFQTNLLALNAAVEAARAGEAGAGFAVVADEVRNLALRAAEAAKNTAALIDGSVKQIQDGCELVDTTNLAFHEVAQSSTKIAQLVAEINAASSEQSQGIEQINTAVGEMDKVVQQNAATAEESASAAEEMNAQAQQMKASVAELVAIVRGAVAGKQPVSGAPATRSPVPAASAARLKPAKTAKPPKQDWKTDPEKVIPFDDAEFADF